jgi:hypothetical protein
MTRGGGRFLQGAALVGIFLEAQSDTHDPAFVFPQVDKDGRADAGIIRLHKRGAVARPH